MLSAISAPPIDPLWGLATAFRQDPRPDKMDLIVGVYRDEAGHTPVLAAVRAAEHRLAELGLSKAYRSLAGNAAFNAGMAKLLLGEDRARLERQHTMQTVGGSGALRLLADFIAHAAPQATVWMSDPGYVNHRPLMQAAGLKVVTYRWRERHQALDMDAVLDDLNAARKGDVVILHGCCHNPTGIDMSREAWQSAAEFCERKGLIPLIDTAYQGFGDGLDSDAEGLRLMVDRLETVLLTASCSKNMGLYCERTGTATVVGASAAALRNVPATLERLTRSNYSMPPEHGAAIATILLEQPDAWRRELDDMRARVAATRMALADALAGHGAPDSLQSLRHQKGMFSLLPMSAESMARLRDEFAIYGTEGGRINIAGIQTSQIDGLARALAAVSGLRRAA
jgi:aspartate aminotransferase